MLLLCYLSARDQAAHDVRTVRHKKPVSNETEIALQTFSYVLNAMFSVSARPAKTVWAVQTDIVGFTQQACNDDEHNKLARSRRLMGVARDLNVDLTPDLQAWAFPMRARQMLTAFK
jgi:hypothetical protein